MLATVFASYMTFQEYLIFLKAQTFLNLLVQELFLVCCIHAKEVGFKHVLLQSEIFYLRQFVLNLSNFINISNKYAKLSFLMQIG